MQQELNELRKQVRTLQRMLFGLLGLATLAGLLAATTLQSQPDAIQATQLEIVDPQGNVMVVLGTMKDGESHHGYINTLNDQGKSLIRLEGNARMGMIQTQNNRGQALARITADPAGTWGSIKTLHASGPVMVTLAGSVNGDGIVRVNNAKGGNLVELGSDVAGDGVVVTENGKGAVLVALSSTENGEGVVVTKNEKGARLVRIAVSDDGSGEIKVHDKKGEVISTSP